jgi:hypothetical protein
MGLPDEYSYQTGAAYPGYENNLMGAAFQENITGDQINDIINSPANKDNSLNFLNGNGDFSSGQVPSPK